RSRRLSTLIVLAATVIVGHRAGASQIAYDGFAPSFPIYANGGTGFSGPWTQGGFNAFASGYTPMEDSLCYGKLQTGGGRVSGGPFSAINGAVRTLQQPLGADHTTVYLSFLVQPLGKLGNGIFGGFFGVTLNGVGSDLFVGKPGGGASDEYVL